MVGRNIPSKRFDAGLEAFAQVLAAFPEAHLLLVGKDAGALARLAADLGIADRVHLLGAVPHADLPGVYRAATLFLNPSVLETFGNVTCEAMACGLPVVAADAPGTRFQVEDGQTGVLVKAPSPQRLAAAMIRVLARPDGGAAMGAAPPPAAGGAGGAPSPPPMRRSTGGWRRSPPCFPMPRRRSIP
jgi:glycosyltransferase involved in cell wall biosynthesis